jgi:hypothetical protein
MTKWAYIWSSMMSASIQERSGDLIIAACNIWLFWIGFYWNKGNK